MWQIALSAITLLFLWGFFGRKRHIPEVERRQLVGTEPWRYPDCYGKVDIWNWNIHRTSQGCRDVLTSSWRDEKFHAQDLQLTLLETRAGPNLRLVDHFGIDNSFTTIDESYHKDLKVKIAKLLKTSDEEWRGLWISLKEIVHNQVERQASKDNFLLVPLVQTIVFKVVILKFFPEDSKFGEDTAIANVTQLINKIWMNSKYSSDPEPTSGVLDKLRHVFKRCTYKSKDEDLTTLKRELRCVLPGVSWKDPRQNPLNIILPAYETLWRAVFHCIIEVLFRHGDKNGPWKACIAKLGQTLDNNKRFSLHGEIEDRISILNIVNETFRLYPPTKRIYRWEQQENQHSCLQEYPELCAADIEAVHRDVSVWGDNALQFDPERWSGCGADEQKRMMENFLPFGYGSLSCPARGEFAPKFFSLIVVVLVKELEGRFAYVADLEKDRIDGSGPLKAGRDSYTTLKLRQLRDEAF